MVPYGAVSGIPFSNLQLPSFGLYKKFELNPWLNPCLKQSYYEKDCVDHLFPYLLLSPQ